MRDGRYMYGLDEYRGDWKGVVMGGRGLVFFSGGDLACEKERG